MSADEIIENSPFGIIGIDSELKIFGGYDTRYVEANAKRGNEYDEFGQLPKSEKQKLANFMIARWQRYKEAAE